MTKTALITSSAKRVGKHLAETLAKKGYNIAISYNNSKIEALELKEYLTANFKIEVAIYHCDLSDIENTKALADSVIEKFGSSWSVLINNGSTFNKSKFLDDFESEAYYNFNVHLFSAMVLARRFIKNAEKYKMKEVDIINMIDVNIFHNQTSHFYYLLSKKSLAEFTRMLALEVSPIARVNGISPGFIFNLEGNDKNEESSPFVVNKILVKNKNQIQNICQTLGFLLDNKAITGQIIAVDSGEGVNF